MKVLNSEKIKEIFKEEIEKRLEKLKENPDWNERVMTLKQELDVYMKSETEPKKSIISPGLEIRDREGNLYTVKKVEQDYIWVENAVGKSMKINIKRLKTFKVD